MNKFVQGQRWVVDSEPELGLGLVTLVEKRTVRIFFEQGECERFYSINEAPLTRIYFAVDDEIVTNDDQTVVVASVHKQNGLAFYETSTGDIIPETAVSSQIKLNQPFMRLMTGQLDQPKWFHFKRALNLAMSRLWQSELSGLLGARTSLIPHQLFVTQTACHREKVRVLLADEVGLGKTIEACLILSRLIKTERAQRALILVPDALQVQWLVELIRRFNLIPELYANEEHDFNSGQIHILPHTAFTREREAILNSNFHVLIVDEAHNIQQEQESFECLSQLAKAIDHILLLTATPEQLGVESHFQRLKLLDPNKFTSIEQLLEQEKHYAKLNQKIKNIERDRDILIEEYQLENELTDQQIINRLLDSHGVGRLMYRNVRKAVTGFPRRIVVSHPIEENAATAKFEWLAQWLNSNDAQKVFVIFHSAEDVFECEQYLWKKYGIDAAIFHEGQNLIERDRAAAYFADTESGARILICSEIGGEGRNFQFCNHLICMDLPAHPDVLEQRIGRLDRIGQKNDVNIHLPHTVGSEEEILFNWYHQILNCVSEQNPAAGSIHDKHWEIYRHAPTTANEDIIRSELNLLRASIEEGRDALLELNSCRQPDAQILTEKVRDFEKDTPYELVNLASGLLNFHFEETRLGAYNLTPSDKMLIPTLPGIPPEGAEVTFEREIANQREDFLFLTWDSPFISGLWELLHHSELGSASVAMLPSRQLPAGHCLIEACFDIVVQSHLATQCRQFFPSLSLRSVALDVSDKDLSTMIDEHSLQTSLQDVKKYLAREVIQSKKDDIPDWFKKAESFAEQQLAVTKGQTEARAKQYFSEEITRLERLTKINKSVSNDELLTLKNTQLEVIDAISNACQLRLSAVRLIVVTEPQ